MGDIQNTSGIVMKNKVKFGLECGPSTFFLPIEMSPPITWLTEQEQYQVCVICIGHCLTVGINYELFLKYLNIPGFTRSHLFENFLEEEQREASSLLLLKCRAGQKYMLIGNVIEAQVIRLVLAMLRSCGIDKNYFLEVFEAADKTI